MRLTVYADYSLRVLIYVAVQQERLATIAEISEAYGISRNHLMKAVHQLGRLGYLRNVRGRRGGIELARPPAQINLGAVVRDVEDDLALVPCLDPDDASCPIQGSCRLQGVLGEALRAFFAVLDRYTLADLTRDRQGVLGSLLGMEPAPLLPLEQIRRQPG